MSKMTGAKLLVKCLELQGVKFIFGIPGAKIDSVFDALLDSKIKLIVCRHEQNAVFMAAAYGRLTGHPGVVLVTSGPGISNMVTGLLTATTEGDPVVAIGGNVPRSMLLKQSHQGSHNVRLLVAATKSSVEVLLAENIPEIVENSFRKASTPMAGASFISFPQDVLLEKTSAKPLPRYVPINYGGSSPILLYQAGQLINKAKHPLILLGMRASQPENAKAIRKLLGQKPLPVISTYQAAGVIPKEKESLFIGRVGLFKNQPGDQILDLADVLVTIGFNPVEYDSEIWNVNNRRSIIHIDNIPSQIHSTYCPQIELLGDIVNNVINLSPYLEKRTLFNNKPIHRARQKLVDIIESGRDINTLPIHPLRFMYELRQVVDDKTTICCDIGTVYMWVARYFISYRPHQLLFSNGQQTLGVGLPWAIACNYARPHEKIISISGDGGFLFSAMELETAVREKLHFVHFIWRDGAYNMVLEQEILKYGRKSGVDFGSVNIPDFAKAFGAIGLELHHPASFAEIYAQAMREDKPVLIDVPIDYSHNAPLFKIAHPLIGH